MIDDLNEPTMGEKLADLNLAENEEPAMNENIDSSNAKPPSADSIYILLKQALRADDRVLLIDCLFRQDEKVVTNSLSLLKPSEVLKFLLSCINNPVESIDDGEEENDVVIPVIYEDNDESEDEASEDSMDIESVEDGEDPQAHSDISDGEYYGEISD